jgi:hypothetical protein
LKTTEDLISMLVPCNGCGRPPFVFHGFIECLHCNRGKETKEGVSYWTSVEDWNNAQKGTTIEPCGV